MTAYPSSSREPLLLAMKEVAKGQSKLVAKPEVPGLSSLQSAREPMLVHAEVASQLSDGMEDDEVASLSSVVSSWAAAFSDAGLSTAGNAIPPANLVSSSLSLSNTRLAEAHSPALVPESHHTPTTASPRTPAVGLNRPPAVPHAGEVPAYHRLLMPYEATGFGMDRARRDCRAEMVSIVKEVNIQCQLFSMFCCG